ncbi:hypothetical protein EJ063_13885 [Vibrio aquaticus]|uniref:Uncharacterized protein n=1 Tax=Vibrio aquaticus TaxID=2496559 RepID=A0A3S0MMJ2_9VIBR|nr:hypothetical protein [Vibrio aquaticus]RTZ14930.1 hypothetical protein EJ063_13885 [Vibrio aquaticus]
MLLNEIAEIIEFTDTDHLSDAMETYNAEGLVHSNQLPFLSVVYEQADKLLLEKLARIGFKGNLQCLKTTNGDYILFDASKVTAEDVLTQFA